MFHQLTMHNTLTCTVTMLDTPHSFSK